MICHAVIRSSEHVEGRTGSVIPALVLAVSLMAVGLGIVGCDAESPAVASRAAGIDEAEMCDDPGAPDAAAGAELVMERLTIVSNDGAYRLAVEPESGRIPRNRYFALNVWIEGVRQPLDPESATLSVSGGMPHHEHGLNTRPRVDMVSESSPQQSPHTINARVHGLLLHMPGRWELYFDITEAGVTERAQFTFDLP